MSLIVNIVGVGWSWTSWLGLAAISEAIRSCCIRLKIVGYLQTEPLFKQFAPCFLALFYAILAMYIVRPRSNKLTLTLRALQSIQPRRDLVWLLLFWRLCDVVSSSRKSCDACSCGVEEFLAEARLSDPAVVEEVISDCTLPYV